MTLRVLYTCKLDIEAHCIALIPASQALWHAGLHGAMAGVKKDVERMRLGEAPTPHESSDALSAVEGSMGRYELGLSRLLLLVWLLLLFSSTHMLSSRAQREVPRLPKCLGKQGSRY